MKNKDFIKLLKKNRSKLDSGFTLIELITGLVMSVIVVGILGFGVVQVLRLTQEEGSQSQARSQTTRAMDFITDEIRKASEIQNFADNTNTVGFNGTGKKVVLALNVPEINGNLDPDGDGELFGADNDLTTPERIVFYLKSADLGSWEGPQVLYRYGPPIDQDGNYTDGDWVEQALIDKIDDSVVSDSVSANICPTGTNADDRQALSPATSPSGFYACIQYGNKNGIVEDLTDVNGDGRISTADGYTVADDKNGDGRISSKDGEDADNAGISAQIYFTGGIDTAYGENKSNYSTNSKVVARARVPEDSNPGLAAPSRVFFRSLGATYGCNPADNSTWAMRTDFANNINDPNNSTKWVHRDGENRQPQPLKISNTKLEITSVPIEPPAGTTCLNERDPNHIRGNRDLSESDELYKFQRDDDGNIITDENGHKLYEQDTNGNFVLAENNKHTVKHVVDFDDPKTFNGLEKGNPNRDQKFVIDGDQRVVFLKNGTVLNESFLTTGYDPDDNSETTTNGEQKSLGEFLVDNNYATRSGDTFTINNLGDSERIVAFEIGWENSSQPGFDLQDNVFLMRSDLFSKKFESTDFQ